MTKKDGIWKSKPDPEDYLAAHAYLTLLYEESSAKQLVQRLRRATIIQREAKDLLRASGLNLLGRNAPHVAADLKKIGKRKKLSPILVVRGDGRNGLPLIVADGYPKCGCSCV